MELILWRHAEAEDGVPDEARNLTAKGEKQAAAAARWLKARLSQDFVVLASPTQRTRQTAGRLVKGFDTADAVGPGVSAASVLDAAAWPNGEGTVVVVGHQPTLGQVAARLLCGGEDEWSVKKGGIWWFSSRVRQGAPQIVLRAVMSPDLL
jgi:phosphohistidine phosphatase